MKLYKLLAFASLSFVVAACDKELDRSLDDAGVSVVVNEETVSDGQVIHVKKGTPLQFRIDGVPDYVIFYSGEEGHRYLYRNRTELDMERIESSVLNFSVAASYGNPAGILHVYYSHDFTGLYKNDFEADSLLLEQSYGEGKWHDLVEPTELPQTNGASASFSVDMTPHFGQNLTIAVRYETIDPTTSSQSRVIFSDWGITNTLVDGSTVEIGAGQFGFTALNMNYKSIPASQLTRNNSVKGYVDAEGNVINREGLQYLTVNDGAPGFWNLNNIGTGTLQMNSANVTGDAWTYSWLVSDYVAVNACDADQGVSIKNISTAVDTYEYTYNEVGTYTATFVLTNGNYKYSSSKVCNIIIDVK